MKVLLFGCALFVFVFALGCDNGNSGNPSVNAQISWTEDVTGINMTEVGVATSEISQNSIHVLESGKGTIFWVSSGVEFSKTIDVGNAGESDDGIECEQEGEHEGENEGCVFSFSFSEDELAISK